MAASNKATALKDSYINSIAAEVGPEGMAAAGAFQNDNLAGKLGMKAGGDVASITYNADSDRVTLLNDGINEKIFIKGGEKVSVPQQSYNSVANPYKGKPHGFTGGNGRLSESRMGERALERAFRTERGSNSISKRTNPLLSERNQDSSKGYSGVHHIDEKGYIRKGEAPSRNSSGRTRAQKEYTDSLVGGATFGESNQPAPAQRSSRSRSRSNTQTRTRRPSPSSTPSRRSSGNGTGRRILGALFGGMKAAGDQMLRDSMNTPISRPDFSLDMNRYSVRKGPFGTPEIYSDPLGNATMSPLNDFL